ncbi:MAG TPA: ATP-binding protein [Gemmatimonadales bacterium]|nr:ATP-binding protein [Gemmatimonadales bacterium]
MNRVPPLAAGVVLAHGAIVLVGWWLGWPLFVTPPASFIPMAPSTALAFALLAAALLAGSTWRRVVPWGVAAVALANLFLPSQLDQVLGGGAGQFGRVRLGVMSPVTAAALLPLAMAIGLLEVRRQLAGVLATIAAAVGATVALGYAFGTPLLYGSGTIPVALPTGLSLLLLGGAVVLVAGPGVWPWAPLTGPSPRARMLRAFLPATAALILLLAILDARFGEGLGADRVLVAAWLAVGGLGLMTLLVSRLAAHIGRRLERAETRYREMFEQALAGVATTNVEGRILLCNDAFAKIFGYDAPHELIGQQAASLYAEAEDRPRVLAALRETGHLRNFELRMRRRDGKPVWVLANLTLHKALGGEMRIENTVLDVSDRKSLEQQLWQAQKLDALGGLAGGVAHDFNNILTAVVGYADLVRQDLPPGDPHTEDMDEIIKASDRAAALTRQLLAFSRRQPFEPKALRLDRVVSDLEKMLRRLLGPDVRLVTAGDADLAAVWADPNQIEQVIMNLAVNSRDAMPKGGTLTIETRTVELDERYPLERAGLEPGRYVMLAVSDTGCGMDQATLDRVFEPFFTTKEKGKGTGLGLATVYGIVKQSKGTILPYSEPGVGTTFKCYFPTTDAAVRTSGPAVAAPQADGHETILLVEDEEPIRALAVSALERQGYHVLPAADGETAMQIAAAHAGPIHLVLSDGVLSGIRVPELLRRLRAQRPETRILLMSGYSQEAVFQNDIVEPDTAFLAKPFTVRQLRERVREVLDAPMSPRN